MSSSTARRTAGPIRQKPGQRAASPRSFLPRLSPLRAFIAGNLFLALLVWAVGWKEPSRPWSEGGHVTLRLGAPRRKVTHPGPFSASRMGEWGPHAFVLKPFLLSQDNGELLCSCIPRCWRAGVFSWGWDRLDCPYSRSANLKPYGLKA
jgi:hypothetical protein